MKISLDRKFNKQNIIRFLVILGIVLSAFGILQKLFGFIFIDFGKNIIDNYLQKSYEESKKLFITLSLMKGTTDVIEGSTINLNSIVGMDLQVGDIMTAGVRCHKYYMESFVCISSYPKDRNIILWNFQS